MKCSFGISDFLEEISSLFHSIVFPFCCFSVINPEKTIIQKDKWTAMFIAMLFTVSKTWGQPKCPSTDEKIKKMWYIYTTEYYSAIKRNGTGSSVVTWMNLESVIQSEVSQKEKTNMYINAYTWNPKKKKWCRWTYLQGRKERVRQKE